MSEDGKFTPEAERTTLTWGRGRELNYKNHSGAYGCVNSECRSFVKPNEDVNKRNTVGVKKAPYPSVREEGEVIKEYAQVICCPDCEKDFWFHVTKEKAEDLLKEN